MVKLVFARHGESEWNKANLFTGWADVDLSEKGTQQAIDAGKLIKEAGIEFDQAYTSVLKRAIKTTNLALEAHLTVYPNEIVKTLLEAVNSNVAQLLIVSELTIAEGPAPEAAVSFEDVAFTVERAAGDVCDRCRRIDPTTAERSYHAVICDHCASIVEENFADAVAEGFEEK